MADLTALDMARLKNQDIGNLSHQLHSALTGETIDCTLCSDLIRRLQTNVNDIRDHVFTVNREQRDSDEAIQKQQILYKKEQERLAREARERAELEALKPVPFSLD